MSMLARVQRGRAARPPRILLYGVEGIGKSTVGSQAPKPIFIQTEDGLDEIACERFPLGAQVTLAGVIGRDLPGGQVLDLLDDHRIAPHLWADSTRPTTNKTRFILRGQLRPDRFDFESKAPIPGEAVEYLAACPMGDALLIQDYGKGVCTAPLLRSLLLQATAAGVPVLADPARGRDLNATYFAPVHGEPQGASRGFGRENHSVFTGG